jgi:hypothetical protein
LFLPSFGASSSSSFSLSSSKLNSVLSFVEELLIPQLLILTMFSKFPAMLEQIFFS